MKHLCTVASVSVASALLSTACTTTYAWSDDEARPVYLYCKAVNFQSYDNAYVCDFGKTESQGCSGWQHGRIDKKDVESVDHSYKQCSNGKMLTRVKVRKP